LCIAKSPLSQGLDQISRASLKQAEACPLQVIPQFFKRVGINQLDHGTIG
jgi:hypothetical protein